MKFTTFALAAALWMFTAVVSCAEEVLRIPEGLTLRPGTVEPVRRFRPLTTHTLSGRLYDENQTPIGGMSMRLTTQQQTLEISTTSEGFFMFTSLTLEGRWSTQPLTLQVGDTLYSYTPAQRKYPSWNGSYVGQDFHRRPRAMISPTLTLEITPAAPGSLPSSATVLTAFHLNLTASGKEGGEWSGARFSLQGLSTAVASAAIIRQDGRILATSEVSPNSFLSFRLTQSVPLNSSVRSAVLVSLNAPFSDETVVGLTWIEALANPGTLLRANAPISSGLTTIQRPPPTGYSIRGRLLGPDRAPLSNLTLIVTGSGGSRTLFARDAYDLWLPAGGTYTLTPRKPGHDFEPVTRVYSTLAHSFEGQDFTGASVSVPADHFLVEGFLTDELSGAPRPGLTLDVWARSPDHRAVIISHGVSREDGLYRLTLPTLPSNSPLTWKVFSRQDRMVSFIPHDREYPGSSSAHQLGQDFIVHDLSNVQIVLRGRVIDEQGRPFTGVSLKIRYARGDPTHGGEGERGVREDGSYAILANTDSTCTIRPMAFTGNVRFDPVAHIITRPNADLTLRDFIASSHRPFIVRGTIKDEAGLPISNVKVKDDITGGPTTRTNTQGVYEITLSSYADHYLMPEKTGYAFTPRERWYTPLESDLAQQDFTGRASSVSGLSGALIVPMVSVKSGHLMFHWRAVPLESGVAKYLVRWRARPSPDWRLLEIPVAVPSEGARSPEPPSAVLAPETPSTATIEYQVQAIGHHGEVSSWSSLTRVALGSEFLPRLLNDVANYPNPFDSRKTSTTIRYTLKEQARLTLLIYDLTGQLARTWDFPSGAPGGEQGLNEVSWDGRNGDGAAVADGVYLGVLKAVSPNETDRTTRKILVIH